MKVEFNSFTELLEKLDYDQSQICQTIDQIFGKLQKNYVFKTNTIVLVSYGTIHYKCSTYDGPWPLISFTAQKNNISLYLMLYIDGKPFIERYSEIFGKSNVGKGCIRIKKLNEERIKALNEIATYLAKNNNHNFKSDTA